MTFLLQTVSIQYSYTRQQVINKMSSNAYLDPLSSAINEDFTRIQTQMNKEITEIYTAAFQSTVPIKAQTDKRGRVSLGLSQRQSIVTGLSKGIPVEDLIKNVVKTASPEFGGTLRNRHILNNVKRSAGYIPASLEGRVWVDDAPHMAPYKATHDPASEIARELEEGGGAGHKFFNRSRPSQAEPGFTAVTGQTRFWTERARIQADPLVQSYLDSISSTVKNISKAEQTPAITQFINRSKAQFTPAAEKQREQERLDYNNLLAKGAQQYITALSKKQDRQRIGADKPNVVVDNILQYFPSVIPQNYYRGQPTNYKFTGYNEGFLKGSVTRIIRYGLAYGISREVASRPFSTAPVFNVPKGGVGINEGLAQRAGNLVGLPRTGTPTIDFPFSKGIPEQGVSAKDLFEE